MLSADAMARGDDRTRAVKYDFSCAGILVDSSNYLVRFVYGRKKNLTDRGGASAPNSPKTFPLVLCSVW